MAPFTLYSGSHHDNLAHLTDAHEDEAPLWMMLLHWLLAIGNDKVNAARMYQAVLDKHRDSNMAETAKLYLATLAFWAKDWRKALMLHQEFIRDYPVSQYVAFVAETRIPAINAILGKVKKQ